MTDEQKKLLEGLTALLDSSLQDHILFTEDEKQSVPIKISLRSKLLPGEDEAFSRTLRKFIGKNSDVSLYDRLLADQNGKRRKKNSGLRIKSIVAHANLRLEETSPKNNINKLAEEKPSSLSSEDAASLVLHIFITWKGLSASLRMPRKVSEKTARGYFKLRDEYSHQEIIDGLVVYGKWAEAKHRAIAAGEIDSFWFYRWDLDKFLLSNKSMDHVSGGWRELVTSKHIPEEYAPIEVQVSSKTFMKNVEFYAKDYAAYGTHSVDANNMFNKMPGLKEAVEKRAKELKNAA